MLVASAAKHPTYWHVGLVVEVLSVLPEVEVLPGSPGLLATSPPAGNAGRLLGGPMQQEILERASFIICSLTLAATFIQPATSWGLDHMCPCWLLVDCSWW